MKREREHFNEEHLNWRIWEEHLNWRAWNTKAGTGPSGQEISPLLRETVLAMRKGIQQAIADAEGAKVLPYEVVQGRLLTTVGGRSTYQFHLIRDVDLEEQTTVNAIIPEDEGVDRKIEARVVSKMELEIRLSTRELLPEELLARLTLIEDRTWLLKRQLRALDHLQETEAQMGAKTLGLLQARSGVEVVKQLGAFVPNISQKQAIARGLGSERIFIVGSGGTGKTVTTGNLICRFLAQGLSVLLVSHTNIATDNAFLDVVDALFASKKSELVSLIALGMIVRQGTPHHLELLKGEYRELTVEALAEQRMGAQTKAREQAKKTHQELLQRIERLKRDIQQQEHDWQPRRQEFEQKNEPSLQSWLKLLQSLLRLRKKREAQADEQRKVSDQEAKAQIIQQEQELKRLQKALEKGQASLTARRTQLEQQRTELAEIEARLEEFKAAQESLRTQIVADARLVATTTTGVYVNPRLLEREFDVVVIDELSMVPLVSVLLVATRATRKFVGAGDPTQLSPVLKLNEPKLAPLAQEWLGKNLYTYLGITIEDAINGEKDCVLLTEQGRMHPTISAPINVRIYGGILTDREETKNFPSCGPYSSWPLMLVDSSRSGARAMKPNEHTARINTVHADIDVALVRLALAGLPPRSPENQFSMSPRIGVITPYRSQVHLIHRKLREARLLQDVYVGTINTVQSLQFEVVIFDTVEAPDLRPFDFTFDAIFDAQGMATEATRKLNVAHTRARYKLIYVAHRDWLHQRQPSNPDNVRASRRLLVELVDEAYNLGHVDAEEILGQQG